MYLHRAPPSVQDPPSFLWHSAHNSLPFFAFDSSFALNYFWFTKLYGEHYTSPWNYFLDPPVIRQLTYWLQIMIHGWSSIFQPVFAQFSRCKCDVDLWRSWTDISPHQSFYIFCILYLILCQWYLEYVDRLLACQSSSWVSTGYTSVNKPLEC